MWADIREAVGAAVVEARMREVPHAEDALRDLAERGPRGIVAHHVLGRLAEALADELDA